MQRPPRRDAAAFQLAAALDELDLEVARLLLNPHVRTILTSSREHAAKARALCDQLGIPAAAPEDLETALKGLRRQIGGPESITDLSPYIVEVRHVTHAVRAVCIAIVAKNSHI